MPKFIYFKLINKHYNDFFISYFRINKTKELISQKYNWLSCWKDVEAYIKGFDVCLALKAIKYKPYKDLKSMPILTSCSKNLLINFVTSLPMFTNWKGKTYNLIQVIIDQLTKIIYHKLVKVSINACRLDKVIFNIIV